MTQVPLFANSSLPRPLCSRLRPDVRDRQTDVRHASSVNATALWGRGHNNDGRTKNLLVYADEFTAHQSTTAGKMKLFLSWWADVAVRQIAEESSNRGRM